MSEATLQAMVVELARYTGWLVMHTRPARTADGRHVTPIQGDAGYPDLTLARNGRVVFAELKSARGRTTPAQDTWLATLGACTTVETHLWRPDDWDLIEATLTRRTP